MNWAILFVLVAMVPAWVIRDRPLTGAFVGRLNRMGPDISVHSIPHRFGPVLMEKTLPVKGCAVSRPPRSGIIALHSGQVD